MCEFVECEKHEWKYERGSAVCGVCGLVNEEDLQLVSGFGFVEEKEVRTKGKISPSTRRAIRLDKRIKYQIKKNYLLSGLLDVLAEIDISMVQKQLIVNHVKKLNPKNWKDIFDYFILTIIKFEIPITNKAMLRVLKKYKLGKKAFEDFKYKQRNYDWYIWKLLANLKFLIVEEMMVIYKQVRVQYNYVLSKTIGIDPTALIGCLCYHVVRKKYGDNSKKSYISPKYRNMGFFNINRKTYQNYKERGYFNTENN